MTAPAGPPLLTKMAAKRESLETERAKLFLIWRTALEKTQGNVTEAATSLGANKNRGIYMVRRLGLVAYAGDLRAKAGQPRGSGRPKKKSD